MVIPKRLDDVSDSALCNLFWVNVPESVQRHVYYPLALSDIYHFFTEAEKEKGTNLIVHSSTNGYRIKWKKLAGYPFLNHEIENPLEDEDEPMEEEEILQKMRRSL